MGRLSGYGLYQDQKECAGGGAPALLGRSVVASSAGQG